MPGNLNTFRVGFIDFRGSVDIFRNIPNTEMVLDEIQKNLIKELDNLVLEILEEKNISLGEAQEKCLMLGSTKTDWEYLVYEDDTFLLGLGPYKVEETINNSEGIKIKVSREVKQGKDLLKQLELEE